MNLHVFDQNQQIGPFPEENVREMLRVGSLTPQAMVWYEGAAEWIPATTHFGQSASATPPVAATPVHPAAAAVARAASGPAQRSTNVPTEGTLFVRALGAGVLVAIVLGVAWAVLQVVTDMTLQLPLIIGSAIAYLCGWTVLKVSRGRAGWAWIGTAIGCAILAWMVGIFGVVVMGATPRIGLWTIVSFFFAMGTAWRVATE